MNYKLLSIVSLLIASNVAAAEKMHKIILSDASKNLNANIDYSKSLKLISEEFQAVALKVNSDIRSDKEKTYAIAYGSAFKISWWSSVTLTDRAIVERAGSKEPLIKSTVFTVENINQLEKAQAFYARKKIALEKEIKYEKPESKDKLFFTAIASSVVTPMLYYLLRKSPYLSPYLTPQKNVASYFGIRLVGIAGASGLIYGAIKMSQLWNYAKYKQDQDQKVVGASIKLNNTVAFLNPLNKGFDKLKEAETTADTDASLKGKQAIIQLKGREESKIHTPLYTTESNE